MLTYTPLVKPLAYFPDFDLVVAYCEGEESIDHDSLSKKEAPAWYLPDTGFLANSPQMLSPLSVQKQYPHKLIVIPRPLLLEGADHPLDPEQIFSWTVRHYGNKKRIPAFARDVIAHLDAFLHGTPLDFINLNWLLRRNVYEDSQNDSLHKAQEPLCDGETILSPAQAKEMAQIISDQYNVSNPDIEQRFFDHKSRHIPRQMFTRVAQAGGTYLGTMIAAALTMDMNAYPASAGPLTYAIAFLGSCCALGLLGDAAMKALRYRPNYKAAYYYRDNKIITYGPLTDATLQHEMAHLIEKETAPLGYVHWTPAHYPRFVDTLRNVATETTDKIDVKKLEEFDRLSNHYDLEAKRFLAENPRLKIFQAPNTYRFHNRPQPL